MGKLTLEEIRNTIAPVVSADRCIKIARAFEQVAEQMGLPEEECVGGAMFFLMHNLLEIKERD